MASISFTYLCLIGSGKDSYITMYFIDAYYYASIILFLDVQRVMMMMVIRALLVLLEVG